MQNEVRFNVDNFVTYPYQAFSEYTTSKKVQQLSQGTGSAAGTGVTEADTVGSYEVNIQNIISADLTEMLVMFVRDRDNAYHLDSALTAPRKAGLIGSSVRDLELRLNGQTMWFAPGSSYFAFNQPLHCGTEKLMIDCFTQMPPGGPVPNAGGLSSDHSQVPSTIYKMILSQENALQYEGQELFNVPRYAVNTPLCK